MRSIGFSLRTLAASLLVSVLAAAPSVAGNADIGVRAAVASGQSARVIMQFASIAERDAAFRRLLDRGAAVRAVDTEAGPALVAMGTATLFASEFGNASQVSLDAGVSVLAATPARGRWVRPVTPQDQAPFEGNGARNGYAVAIVDSGIAPHADLPLSRIRAYKDFVTGGRTPVDNCGHGTHVAGIVAGSGAQSDGAYAGIVPDADLVVLRVLGDDCSGNTSDVIDALEWIARHHDTYKIKVVNLSLGHAVLESIFTDPLVQAVERLSRKGVAVVTAAGNKGINPATGGPGYGGAGVPCNAPSSICVGSLDTHGSSSFSDDGVSPSSSRGPTRFDLLAKPDLVAPGVNIVSLAARGSRLFNQFPALRVAGANGKAEYFTLSGTSMSSPAVAGAAALLLRQNSRLSVHALKISLQFTARLVPQSDVLTQGAGALNIPGALTLADAINPNVPHGANWIRQRLTAANRDAAGNVVRWSRRIIYGDRFVRPQFAEYHLFRWDNDVVWAFDALEDNIVWGNADDDNIVWGNNDTIVRGDEDNIVWGNAADDNIVWGNDESDNIVWGVDDNIVWGNDDNIVWGNSDDDNIVWGNSHLRDVWASNVVWGFWDDNIVWGNITRDTEDNIVWGNNADNIVWGNCSDANDDPSTSLGADNIVWGNLDNIVWGNCGDNIVWGNDDDNIVWGNSVLTGGRR